MRKKKKRKQKRNLKIKLKEMTLKDIIWLVKKIGKIKDSKNKRGRPRKYSESLIIALLFLKVIQQLSFRELIYWARQILGEVPALSTLHYRFRKISLKVIRKIEQAIIDEILKENEDKKFIEIITIDGTGFGYDQIYRLNYMRGQEIREVSSHVKVVAIVGTLKEGINVVLRVALGPPYSDERKLGEPLLEDLDIKSKLIIADKLYGMKISMLEKFLKIAKKVIIPIQDTLRHSVKNPVRLAVKKCYEENKGLYCNRYIIEQTFAKIKNSYGRCEGAVLSQLAKLYSYVKFVAYNFAVLKALLFLFFCPIIFRTHSQNA